VEREQQLDLSIWRDMTMVSVIRRFVEEVYEQVFDDLDAVSRITLAAHELLENAVKYSSDGPARIRVSLERGEETDRIAIAVTNRADHRNLAALQAVFQEMQAVSDPLVHYQTLLRRNYKRKDGSGLGLARVQAEGEMLLTLEVSDGHEVCLRATADFEGRRVS
jgi:anti-sigma regulatory factor (Ser/Thr protein kinase)